MLISSSNSIIALFRAVSAAAVLAAFGVVAPASITQSLPAFHGAYGYGADTPGGRGGEVILDTKLR